MDTTYENTKAYLMARYPQLFPTEAHVLHHLFFVVGSGMRWVKGRLMDPSEPLRSVEEAQELYQRHLETLYQEWGVFIAPLRELLEDIPGDALHPPAYEEPVGEVPYLSPLCQWSIILHLPDDIHPGWLDAASRAVVWARTVDHTPEDEMWLREIEKIIRRIEESCKRRNVCTFG